MLHAAIALQRLERQLPRAATAASVGPRKAPATLIMLLEHVIRLCCLMMLLDHDARSCRLSVRI